jgi:hypothetical protein
MTNEGFRPAREIDEPPVLFIGGEDFASLKPAVFRDAQPEHPAILHSRIAQRRRSRTSIDSKPITSDESRPPT